MITFSYLIFPNFFVCFLDGLWISQHLIFICPYFQDWLENVFKHQDFNITLLLKKFLNKLRTFFASFAQKTSFYNICICSQRPVFNRIQDCTTELLLLKQDFRKYGLIKMFISSMLKSVHHKDILNILKQLQLAKGCCCKCWTCSVLIEIKTDP